MLFAREHSLSKTEPHMWRVVPPQTPDLPAHCIESRIAAGPPIPPSQCELGVIQMDLTALGITASDQTFALRVDGDSMINAGIHDGDMVILEKCEHRDGDIVAATVNDEVTLKRIVYEGGRPILRPENARYEDILPAEDSTIQGVAVGLIRKLR